MQDHELFAHYVARGREPWNVSLEASWLDYTLRAYVAPLLSGNRSLAICNVGIGVGLWDDWLGHMAGASITSVDRDPDLCRIFAARQVRELHPFPARVICGDVLRGAIGDAQFDLVTCIGSTLAESGDALRMRPLLEERLTQTGRLVLADVDGDVLGVVVNLTTTDHTGRIVDEQVARLSHHGRSAS